MCACVCVFVCMFLSLSMQTDVNVPHISLHMFHHCLETMKGVGCEVGRGDKVGELWKMARWEKGKHVSYAAVWTSFVESK